MANIMIALKKGISKNRQHIAITILDMRTEKKLN